MNVERTWFGGASVRLKDGRGRVIFIDPWLDAPPAGYEIPRELNTKFTVDFDGLTQLYAGDTVPGDEIYRSVGAELISLQPGGTVRFGPESFASSKPMVLAS